MSGIRVFALSSVGILTAALALLVLVGASPVVAQHRGNSYSPAPPPPANYSPYGSYGQRYDSRVVIAYGQPSAYDYGYSYGYSGSGAPVYETEARVYAATGAVATGYSYESYGYSDGYGYQRPRHPDRYAYQYRERHDRYGYDRHDRGGRYGYSRERGGYERRGYQGYRDEYGYQDDRPRTVRRYDRRDDRRERRYDRRDYCDCSDVYLYDR